MSSIEQDDFQVFREIRSFSNSPVTWNAIKKQKGPLKNVKTPGLSFPAYIPHSLLYYIISNPFLA